MCLLESNATADEGFIELKRAGDKTNYERRLAQMANEDSIEQAQSLHLQLEAIESWRQHPDLRTVRKVRIGRHRAYIQGRHTDCLYRVCYIKVHKRDEERREENARFQNQVLRALAQDPQRILAPLPPDEARG